MEKAKRVLISNKITLQFWGKKWISSLHQQVTFAYNYTTNLVIKINLNQTFLSFEIIQMI